MFLRTLSTRPALQYVCRFVKVVPCRSSISHCEIWIALHVQLYSCIQIPIRRSRLRGAVRAFVAAGGGYIGTCGGAFLGLQHLFFFGEGPLGPAGHRGPPTQEPFDRGHGDVQVEFTPQGLEQIHLPPATYSGNVTIMCEYMPPITSSTPPPSLPTTTATATRGHHYQQCSATALMRCIWF